MDELFACEEYVTIDEQLVMYSELESVKSGNEIKYHKVLSKYESELSGEARDFYMDTLSVLGAVYGMSGEGFMNSVKSVYKSLEIYARKFMAMVGKWIAKAQVRWKLNGKLSKELIERYERYNDVDMVHIDKEDIEKLGSIIKHINPPKYIEDADGSARAAEDLVKNEADFTSNFDCEFVKIVATSPVGDKKEIGLDEINSGASPLPKEVLNSPILAIRFMKTEMARDGIDAGISFYAYRDLTAKGPAKWAAGVIFTFTVEVNGKPANIMTEIIYTLTKKKDFDLKPGDYELNELGVYPSLVLMELRLVTPELLKTRIDVGYEKIKKILDLSTVKDAEDPVKAKQVMIDTSKLAFKTMMDTVKSQNDKLLLYKTLADKIDEYKNKNK